MPTETSTYQYRLPLSLIDVECYNLQSNDPLVQFEFEEIKAAIDFDKNVASNIGWLALFKTPGNRRRVRIILGLAFFSQWSGNGLV